MSIDEMKDYTFYFLDGTVLTEKGNGVGDAFSRLGFSSGAIASVDVYEESTPSGTYVYDESARSWKNIKM